MGTLNGARVALLEARMGGELANLVRRHGGVPSSVPAVEEAPLACEDEVAALIDCLAQGEVRVLVFLTGAGVKALLVEAERLGRLAEFRTALGTVTVVCRGPKPVAALLQQGLSVSVKAPAPHTTTELLAAMDPLHLHRKGVAVVHYGERNEALADALCARGARLHELCLYAWQLPADRRPLEALVGTLLDGGLDVIAFTSQVQLRHLLAVATAMGRQEALLTVLRSRLTVASIGPTCTAALQEVGITPQVEPTHGKMGHLVAALAGYLTQDVAVGRPPWPMSL